MKASHDKIHKEFLRIKQLGFIKSNRKNNTGIGKTFEDYLGVIENNNRDADFDGFEVKSHRELASSYISLFTKSPTSPRGANTMLKNKFGKSDSVYPELKALHTSVFAHRWNTLNEGQFCCKLKIDRQCEKLSLIVADGAKNILSSEVYWSFGDLKKSMQKLSSLFVVTAKTESRGADEYFHYTNAQVFHNISFHCCPTKIGKENRQTLYYRKFEVVFSIH